jgi:hypothetical protein
VRLAEILSDSRTSAIVGVAIAWSFRADDGQSGNYGYCSLQP